MAATLKVVEIMTNLNERSCLGRVVINPPKTMAPLQQRPVGKIKICCGRAFLSEDSYNKHREDRTTEHLNDLWNAMLEKDDSIQPVKAKSKSSSKNTAISNKNETKSKPNRSSKTGKVIKCSLCKILMSAANYSRHLKHAHNPSNKVKCKWCTCTFSVQKLALRHGSRCHPVQYKKFTWKAATLNKHVISARNMTTTPKIVPKNTMQKKSTPPPSKNTHFNTQLETVNNMNRNKGVTGKRIIKKTHSISRSDDAGFLEVEQQQSVKVNKGARNTRNSSATKMLRDSNSIQDEISSELVDEESLTANRSARKKVTQGFTPVLKEQPSPKVVSKSFTSKKRKPTHKCIFCGKVLTNKVSFQHHLLIHSGDRPYKCQICSFSFRHTGNLSRHYKNVHPRNLKFQCALCPNRFYTQETLLEHMKRRHPESFRSNNSLEVISPKRKTPSPVKTMPMPSAKVVKSKNGYHCTVCGKVLKHLLTYRGHMLIHAGVFPIKCSKCNARFRLKTTLDRHLATNHVENGPLKCSKCPCTFNNPRGLIRHKQCYHSGTRQTKMVKSVKTKSKLVPPVREISPDISTMGIGTSLKARFPRGKKSVINTEDKIGNAFESFESTVVNITKNSRSQVEKVSKISHVDAEPLELPKEMKKANGVRKGVKRKMVAKRGVKKAKLENDQVEIKRVESQSPEREPSSPVKEKEIRKRIILKISKRKHIEIRHVDPEPEKEESKGDENEGHSEKEATPQKDAGETEENSYNEGGRRKRRTRNSVSNLECKVCQRKFASPQSRRLHESLHTGEKQFCCDYCNLTFRLFSTFHFHIKRFENPNGNFFCSLCIAKCGSEEALAHHMAIHKYQKRNYSKNK